MALQDNVKPGHCCLCGNRNRFSLCKPCFGAWVQPDGRLPEWLFVLRRNARRENDRYKANLRRVQRGTVNRKTGGAPQQFGVVFVSLDRLLAEAGTNVGCY